MEEKDLPLGPRLVQGVDTAATETHDLQIMCADHNGPVGKPRAAGGGESIGKKGRCHAALEVVITGSPVNRRFDLADEIKCFRREARVFHEIAGEADEIGRELIDRADNVRGVLGIAFVMKVAEVNEAAIAGT